MTDGSSHSASEQDGPPSRADAGEHGSWPVRIHALGRFQVWVDGQLVQTEGKPLALLRRLVLHGGRCARVEELAAALWPHRRGNTRGIFDVTLLRLRKRLGRSDALLIRHGELALNPDLCWLDLWHFERCSPPQGFEVDDLAISALKSYRGAFLPMETDDGASIVIRERLRTHFHVAVLHVGAHLERSGDWNRALQIYHHATQTDPLVEDYYYRQMLCQVELGKMDEVRNTYERCRECISQEFNVRPSARLDQLLDRALAGRSIYEGEIQSVQVRTASHGASGDSASCQTYPDQSGSRWPISIRTLGPFNLTSQGTTPGMLRNGPRRPLDLLRALVALGGQAVPVPALIDAVWNSREVVSRGVFDSALLRLRKLLAREDAVHLQCGLATLNAEICWVDAWEFERAAMCFFSTHLPADAERALSFYGGEFLGSMDMPRCAAAVRERLSQTFRQIITTLGNLYERARDWDGAARTYQHGVAVDGSVEDFHRRLIHCCWRMGHQNDAIRVYHRCRDALLALSQRSPSAATIELYRQVLDSSPAHS